MPKAPAKPRRQRAPQNAFALPVRPEGAPPPVIVEEVELDGEEAHWSQLGAEKSDQVLAMEKFVAERKGGAGAAALR